MYLLQSDPSDHVIYFVDNRHNLAPSEERILHHLVNKWQSMRTRPDGQHCNSFTIRGSAQYFGSLLSSSNELFVIFCAFHNLQQLLGIWAACLPVDRLSGSRHSGFIVRVGGRDMDATCDSDDVGIPFVKSPPHRTGIL